MTKAEKIFEQYWTKATGKSLDETTKAHMSYCIQAIDSVVKQRDELLGISDTFTLKHIIDELIKGCEILLYEKDYDGHGWEILSKCVDLAKEKQELLTKIKGDE